MAKRGFGGGMMPGNMNNLLKQAQKMQENMQKMQAELEAKEIESSVGGGAVTVKVNGKKELIGRSVKMYITEPTTYSGFCIRCRITDEKVDKDYIAILLKTPIIRQFMTNSGRGCNISNLNQKILNSIPTILPPLPLQRLFAQHIEQIEREKSEVQKSIQDLETLQASRMQYWFE